ncbi:murein transglycosylase [Fusarium pseudocircinatum]|uniref:Crh-like protein n=1 Tax=Fusarium pseudocircinatum TaxID=56676 RepID=A0A8H5PG35_9HYPO|nr:murein transglycosylase [Fusarium pseudocircinatum]
MLRSLVVAALLGASSVAAVKCTRSSHCPEDSPCCSTYGECGVGAYCLGGCDPTMSFSLDSCVPAPVCEDRKMKMNSLDSIVDIGKYLGDSSKADWVAQGEPVVFQNNVLLTMPKDSVGTLLSSTVYMWYGNVKARFKTSRGAGVITAFILFSDVKDEIDYEFVGTELGDAQTNYYFQGITNYENSENITLSDTFANFHDYEIRWTPDKIEWWVDGKLGRTLQKSDTWNATSKNFDFPQTPSRVQLSLWPGGKEGNAEGTVAWAGGPIDWDAPDIQKSGYYFATFSDVEIECYNAKSGPGTNSGTSYWYKDAAGTNDTIVDGDKRHTIASLMATGEDMDKGKKEDKKKDSKDDDKDDKDSKDSKDKDKDDDDDDEPATIPGGSSGAPSNDHGDDSSSDSSSGSGSSNTPSGNPDGDSNDTEPADTTNCETNSFNQDCASSGSSKSSSSSDDGKGSNAGTRNGASALAIIIAGGALFWL